VNARLARLLTRLYPRAWRERYGREFEEFLENGSGGLRASFNVGWSALREHVIPTDGGCMSQQSYSFSALVRQPTGFLPLAMSFGALATVSIAVMYSLAHGAPGLVRQRDEGPAAHIWQLLMAGQLPVLVFFAVKWLPRAPRQALSVLCLQAGAVLAAVAPVFWLGL
jgi:hypothetical protein